MPTAAAKAAEPTADIWTRLAAPLDQSRIKSREGQGGKSLRYIDAQYVNEILNREVGFENWQLSFHPLTHAEIPTVIATLTINGVTRQGFGQGRDFKAAETDAFKRSAVRFGIGKELYEERGKQKAAATPAAKQQGAGNTQSSNRTSSGNAADRTMPFGRTKGTKLGALDLKELESTRSWCAARDAAKFADLIVSLDEVIAQKRNEPLPGEGNYEEFPAALDQDDDDLPF